MCLSRMVIEQLNGHHLNVVEQHLELEIACLFAKRRFENTMATTALKHATFHLGGKNLVQPVAGKLLFLSAIITLLP